MKLRVILEDGQTGGIDTSFAIVTTLDIQSAPKARYYIDFWLRWHTYFEFIQVPIWIITNIEPSYRLGYEKLSMPFLHFAKCADSMLFDELGSVQSKMVFGNTYTILSPKIYLFYKNEIINTKSRTNDKSIKELYLKALDIRYRKYVEEFDKKFKKVFDTQELIC